MSVVEATMMSSKLDSTCSGTDECVMDPSTRIASKDNENIASSSPSCSSSSFVESITGPESFLSGFSTSLDLILGDTAAATATQQHNDATPAVTKEATELELEIGRTGLSTIGTCPASSSQTLFYQDNSAIPAATTNAFTSGVFSTHTGIWEKPKAHLNEMTTNDYFQKYLETVSDLCPTSKTNIADSPATPATPEVLFSHNGWFPSSVQEDKLYQQHAGNGFTSNLMSTVPAGLAASLVPSAGVESKDVENQLFSVEGVMSLVRKVQEQSQVIVTQEAALENIKLSISSVVGASLRMENSYHRLSNQAKTSEINRFAKKLSSQEAVIHLQQKQIASLCTQLTDSKCKLMKAETRGNRGEAPVTPTSPLGSPNKRLSSPGDERGGGGREKNAAKEGGNKNSSKPDAGCAYFSPRDCSTQYIKNSRNRRVSCGGAFDSDKQDGVATSLTKPQNIRNNVAATGNAAETRYSHIAQDMATSQAEVNGESSTRKTSFYKGPHVAPQQHPNIEGLPMDYSSMMMRALALMAGSDQQSLLSTPSDCPSFLQPTTGQRSVSSQESLLKLHSIENSSMTRTNSHTTWNTSISDGQNDNLISSSLLAELYSKSNSLQTVGMNQFGPSVPHTSLPTSTNSYYPSRFFLGFDAPQS